MSLEEPIPEPNREREAFEAALETPPGRMRDAVVRDLCGGDRCMEERVLALLAAHEASAEFLAERPRSMATTHAGKVGLGAGDAVGRYRILEQIGEGGFGIVYLAEQTEPIRRQVALKVIKPGMDTRQVIGRFEAERRALAMMNHSSIAQVFDAGATDTGHPYFVMELVRGLPITEYCREHQVTVADRLLLFVQVCSAVQHAHQKGIIHRDLKPTNVLVVEHGDAPLPKVIDFGIAKATGPSSDDRAVLTQWQQLLGTPAYMSPEQATTGGRDVDTRSDVYSLGALLYEMLAGVPPFESSLIMGLGPDEWRRFLLETEPERPSARWNRRRERDPSGSVPRPADRWSSDLDRIVLKALEKDREARYPTANGLAADVRRYLNQEPVSAVEPTLAYQMAKFAHRHRKAAATATVFLVLLSVAAVLCAVLAYRAVRAEQLARTRADAAQRVSEFYWKSLLSQLAPWQHTNPAVSLREAFDRSAGEIHRRVGAAPLVEASVRLTVGRTYLGLGEYASAETNLVRALEITRNIDSPAPELVAEILHQLAILRGYQQRESEALALLEELIEVRRRIYPADHREIWIPTIGSKLSRARRLLPVQAIPELRGILDEARHRLGKGHYHTISCMAQLARAHSELGDFQSARELLMAAQGLAIEEQGPASNDALACADLLAEIEAKSGRFDEAGRRFTELLAVRERVNGTNNVFTIITRIKHVGLVLVPKGDYVGASRECERLAETVWQCCPELRAPTRRLVEGLLAAWRTRGGDGDFEAFERQMTRYREP